MHKNSPVGPVAQIIIDSVDSVLDSSPNIVRVDYSPPVDADIALILSKPLDGTDISKIRILEFVESAETSGRFLNLCLSLNVVKFFEANERVRFKGVIAIEHTSLVPVYPLNFATFRSSVVGDWCRRAAIYLGYSTKTRYFVQDSARQVDLVREQLRVGNYQPRKTSIGKGDHTIGRVFAEGICREDGLSVSSSRQFARELFPLGASGVRRPGYTDWVSDVIEGWKSTFRNTGIKMDHFDRESQILKELKWQKILEKAREIQLADFRLPRQTETPSMLTYFEWSILYHYFALGSVERLISVIPARQKHLQQAAKTVVLQLLDRPEADLVIIPVGDVCPYGRRDSLRNGQFTSVDDLNLYENRDQRLILEKFLLCRASTSIDVVFPLTRRKIPPCQKEGRRLKSPTVLAILLLDQLPSYLIAGLLKGDFANTLSWVAQAKICLAELNSSNPTLQNMLESAIEAFDTK